MSSPFDSNNGHFVYSSGDATDNGSEAQSHSQPSSLLASERPLLNVDNESGPLLSGGVVRLHIGPKCVESDSFDGEEEQPKHQPTEPPTQPCEAIAQEEYDIIRQADEEIRESHNNNNTNTYLSSSHSYSSSSGDSLTRWSSFESRLASWSGSTDWSRFALMHPRVYPAALAAAGLYHDSHNSSLSPESGICYVCGIVLSNWQWHDEPDIRHRDAIEKAGKECAFIRALDKVRQKKSAQDGKSHMDTPLDRLLNDSVCDEDSDDLPPPLLTVGASGLTPALVRTPSVEERKLVELVESVDALRLPFRSVRPNSFQLTRDGAIRRTEQSVINNESNRAQLETAQMRQPLPIFDFAAGSDGDQSSSFAYFEVKIETLTPSESPSIHSPSSPSSPPPPNFVVGFRTTPLHSKSGVPGSDPAFLNESSVGITNDGDLLMNGMYPLSGIVGMTNLPFISGGLQNGDVVGFLIDVTRRFALIHVNGKVCGPIDWNHEAMHHQLQSDPAPITIYPTVAIANDETHIRVHMTESDVSGASSSPSSFHSGAMSGSLLDPLLRTDPTTADGARQLYESRHLPSIDAMCQSAVDQLSSHKPDLGLVLDQTYLNPRRAGSVIDTKPLTSSQAPRHRTGSVVASTSSTSVSVDEAKPFSGPLVISKILPDCSADHAGLRVGDQVRSMNGQTIARLSDAVAIVSAATPASILLIEVSRSGRLYHLPLTLGAKGMPWAEFGPLARWKQWRAHHCEWIGPPCQIGTKTDAQQKLSPLSSPPPAYDPTAQRPFNGVEHIRALDIALTIDERLSRHNAPLFMPSYKQLSQRVASFNGQLQSWQSQHRVGHSSIVSATPPTPFNVALHGFFLAPVTGFPGRVVCFACGVVLSSVKSIEELIQQHRRLALESKLAKPTIASTSSQDQPPSYKRQASLLPENLGAGCIFLTIYDAVSAQMCQRQQAQLAQRLHRHDSLQSQVSAPDVVIDVEANKDDEALLSGPSSSSSSSSRSAPNSGRKKTYAGPIQCNTENLARSSPIPSPSQAQSQSRWAHPQSPLDPPPTYTRAIYMETVPTGPDAIPPHRPEEGLLWHAPRQMNFRAARVGEFTFGSIDLPNKRSLTAAELAARNRGRNREPAAAPEFGVRWMSGGGGREDGIEMSPVGVRQPFARLPASPPPPPQPPAEVLKEFFLKGNPIFLLCKIPLFILVLPIFLVWECLKGAYRFVAWLCDACGRCCDWAYEKISNACGRCCGYLADKCGECLDFCCCKVLCDGICVPFEQACRWIWTRVNKYCFQPIIRAFAWVFDQISRCCSAICRAISSCCNAIWNAITGCCRFMYETFCVPVGRCISAVCSAIGRCCSAVCDAIGRCCSAVFKAIGSCCSYTCDLIARCCSWFWTPICDAFGKCLSAIGDCLTWVCKGIYQCATLICDCIGHVLKTIWKGIRAVCKAVWQCLDYVVFTPIAYVSKKIWACISITFEWVVIKPVKGQT